MLAHRTAQQTEHQTYFVLFDLNIEAVNLGFLKTEVKRVQQDRVGCKRTDALQPNPAAHA